MKRGDVYYADLRPVIGSEQGGIRPVLIIQGKVTDKTETILCVAISSNPIGETDISFGLQNCGIELLSKSYLLFEQIRSIDKTRLKGKIGTLSEEYMKQIKQSLVDIL